MGDNRLLLGLVLLFGLSVCLFGLVGESGDVPVSSVTELKAAIGDAIPGDVIILSPGTYVMDVNKVSIYSDGTEQEPITIKANTLGDATIQWGTGLVEGFYVDGPYWVFENLEVEGTCGSDDDCEHAFHILAGGQHTVIRNCKLRDFNAQIKGNGDGSGNFPNDVVIELNELYDTRGRETSKPVTKIDVVGGRRWIVRGNYIHDYQKVGGDGVSYAGFLKGHSFNGLFEKNLVVCESDFTGGTRLGLSFGGGGTSPDSICETGSCSIEHQDGIMRNNIVANCLDVCFYINKGTNTHLYNNIAYNCAGIDFRYSASTGEAKNNVVQNVIRDREGSTHTGSNNIIVPEAVGFDTYFVDASNLDFTLKTAMDTNIVGAGQVLSEVFDDWCSTSRGTSQNDIGPVQYSAYSGGDVCNTDWDSARNGIIDGGNGGDGSGSSGPGGPSGPSGSGSDGSSDADTLRGFHAIFREYLV